MSTLQLDTLSEMYCVSETIENGVIMVTASPEIWVDGHILLWPPGDADRSKPIPPQADWKPIMCKVLKNSIATWEEALVLEKRYSKHRNSDSFRAAQERKQQKRKHPVNENEAMKSNLIDVNSMVSKINSKRVKSSAKSEQENTDPKMKCDPPKSSKYHGLCLDENKSKFKSGASKLVQRPVPRRLNSNPTKNSELPKLPNEMKKPRYENYLKSGRKNSVCSEKQKVLPPPLMRISKPGVSSTITKEQFLKQNAISEYEFEENTVYASSTPLNENAVSSREAGKLNKQINGTENVRVLEIKTKNFESNKAATLPQCIDGVDHTESVAAMYRKNLFTASNVKGVNVIEGNGFRSASAVNNNNEITDTVEHTESYAGMHRKNFFTTSVSNVKGVNVVEDIVLKPAPDVNGNNEISNNIGAAILSSLNEMKYFFKQSVKESEEKRLHFEARMQTQWELFTKKVLLTQGQNNGLAESLDDTEDFEDLDEYFPITRDSNVEELEWSVQKDLPFKRRMKSRIEQLGGKNENEAVRIRMKYLIADFVLDHFTWKGTGEKKAFEKLTFLNDLIYKSIRSQFAKYTYKAYTTYMIQWIKHSKTRQRTVVYHYPDQQHGNEQEYNDGNIDENY